MCMKNHTYRLSGKGNCVNMYENPHILAGRKGKPRHFVRKTAHISQSGRKTAAIWLKNRSYRPGAGNRVSHSEGETAGLNLFQGGGKKGLKNNETAVFGGDPLATAVSGGCLQAVNFRRLPVQFITVRLTVRRRAPRRRVRWTDPPPPAPAGISSRRRTSAQRARPSRCAAQTRTRCGRNRARSR